jgi:carboxymethylenebutenolidase
VEQTPAYTVVSEDVEYAEGIVGTYARPQEAGEYPGVVMIHEWWGLNDNIKDMARELAGQGYQVLAVDLYHGNVAATSDEARELVGSLNQPEAVQNLTAAVAYLRSQNAVRVASLGWCFGGGQSMQLALAGVDLDATVIYYGNLVTDPAALQEIDWPVLGVFGAEDSSIPVETVRTFEETLDSLNVPHETYIYPGVGHAFANPSGANYAPEETVDAWEKTLRFLEDALK